MFVVELPGPDEPRTKTAKAVLEMGLAQCEFYRDSRLEPSQDLLDDIAAYKLILGSKAFLAEYTMNMDENFARSARKVARQYGWMK